MFHSLQTLWIAATRLLCPWDSPGKNAGASSYFLLQGSSQPKDRTCTSWIGRGILYHRATWEARYIFHYVYFVTVKKKKNPKNKLLSIFFAVGNWQKCQTNSHMPMSEVKRAIWGACVMLGETITTWQNYGCANMKSKSPLIQSQEKHHGVISWWKPWRQEEFPQWRLERLFQTFQVQKQNIDSSALEILESLFNHI